MTDSLYRLHTGPSRVERTITRPPGRDELSARVPGVHHQHGEVSDDPQPYHRVPWPHSGLNHYGAKPPTTKDKANSSRGSKTIERENHFSSQPSTIAREDEFDGVCNPPCPSLLLPSTDGFIQHIREEQPEL